MTRAAVRIGCSSGFWGDIHRVGAAAILEVARVNMLVVDHAVQLHGGLGFMWDSEVNRH
jgi:isovaleryl-CoA dehydrogenase